MARFRILTNASVLSVFALFLPTLAWAADGTFFKQIIPTDGTCVCVGSAPDWGCILQVLQNVINDAIVLGVFLCVAWIAIAGVRLVTSGGNPQSITNAKTGILNAIIGIVVILCSWLVVDFVMKVVYDPSTTFEGNNFGPWNSILVSTGDSYCIKPTTPQALTTGTVDILTGTAVTSVAGSVSQAAGDCSADNLATDWGSAQKGALFSCIINNESRCQNIATQAKSEVAGKGASAGGRYQVNMSSGPNGQGLNFPACVAVARANGFTGTTLNCGAAYPRGFSNGSALATQCRAAQLNPTCNTQVAQYLYANGGVSHWLGIGDIGNVNKSCTARYGT